MSDSILKRCSKCGEEKPATPEYFSRHKRHSGGLNSQCKSCKSEADRIYVEKNKDKISVRKKKYNDKNRESKRQKDRVYRETHKELLSQKGKELYSRDKDRIKKRVLDYFKRQKDKVYAYKRRWNDANKDRLKQYRRRWNKKNQPLKNVYTRKYRAVKRSAEGTHTLVDVQSQYKAQKGKCYYCGCKVGEKYHVDHVIPLSRGGSNGPENIVIACQPCNDSKGSKLPHEWPQGGRLL